MIDPKIQAKFEEFQEECKKLYKTPYITFEISHFEGFFWVFKATDGKTHIQERIDDNGAS